MTCKTKTKVPDWLLPAVMAPNRHMEELYIKEFSPDPGSSDKTSPNSSEISGRWPCGREPPVKRRTPLPKNNSFMFVCFLWALTCCVTTQLTGPLEGGHENREFGAFTWTPSGCQNWSPTRPSNPGLKSSALQRKNAGSPGSGGLESGPPGPDFEGFRAKAEGKILES